jgi:hypothetical protein
MAQRKIGKHYAYVRKAATAATSTYPTNYPLNWPNPAPPVPPPPWPPGWPINYGSVATDTYYYTWTMDANLEHTEGGSPENQETIWLYIFDDVGKTSPATNLEYHLLTLECVDGAGETVQLTKTGDGEGAQDTLYYQITDVLAGNYGFTDDITFDLATADLADALKTLTLTATIISIDPEQSTTDTIIAVAAVP